MTVGPDGVLRLLDTKLRPGSRVRALVQGVTVGAIILHKTSNLLLALCQGAECELRCVDPATGEIPL